MSRRSAIPRGMAGQVSLTRQGISLLTLLRPTWGGADDTSYARMSSLHVAMQMGPSHDPHLVDLRRMVSEDSGQLRPVFPAGFLHSSHCHDTAHSGRNRSARYSGFPAYGRMRTAQLPVRGATNYLRTVHCCYFSSRTETGGRRISGQLLRSPVRSDYLIPAR
jgi:hypothetical protein